MKKFMIKFFGYMFYGIKYLKMAENGRLSMPTNAFNDSIQTSDKNLISNFYLTPGKDNCIYIFSPNQFNLFKNKMQNSIANNVSKVEFDRAFFSSISYEKVDKQNRIAVNDSLKKYAKIKTDVVLIGLENRIELWAKEIWDKFNNTILSVDIFNKEI
jgi:MraZ protein